MTHQSQDSGVLAPLLVWKDLALASIRVILGPLSLCGVFLTITNDKRVLLEMRVMFISNRSNASSSTNIDVVILLLHSEVSSN